MPFLEALRRRALAPALIWLVCATVYTATLGSRVLESASPDNHYVHLAESFLNGELGVIGNKPPGENDWARYDGRWYVSFPPFPAVVIAPAVWLFGAQLADRLFWALLAGLGPALVYVLLRALREEQRSGRTPREDLLLTGLFAFGTVYYFVAVQGTVWFAAQVVSIPLLALYLRFSLDAKRPAWAGLMLGLAALTRPSTAYLCLYFGLEALHATRAQPSTPAAPAATWWEVLRAWLRSLRPIAAVRRCIPFALPIVGLAALAMAFNAARFDNPLEFGHTFLQVRWRSRIEKWGLFNYHYFSKNLAIFLAALPWLSAKAPFIKIGRHGLALWFTTPNLALTLWPRTVHARTVFLSVAALIVAIIDLCYQNSGWVQFGYRFALDYMVLLFALLAIGGRRFGWGFHLLAVFAVAVNLFGAITFDRMGHFYDGDASQKVIFQPD